MGKGKAEGVEGTERQRGAGCLGRESGLVKGLVTEVFRTSGRGLERTPEKTGPVTSLRTRGGGEEAWWEGGKKGEASASGGV